MTRRYRTIKRSAGKTSVSRKSIRVAVRSVVTGRYVSAKSKPAKGRSSKVASTRRGPTAKGKGSRRSR